MLSRLSNHLTHFEPTSLTKSRALFSSTPHRKTLSSTLEYFDSFSEASSKASLIADRLKRSTHPIAFIGAGLSTASGVPDYRSGKETVLETGPGKWETESSPSSPPSLSKPKKPAFLAWPNIGHRCLLSLPLSHILSQNVDGLLYKAGIPANLSTALHGDMFEERCGCGEKRVFRRDFYIPDWETKRHLTGRYCDCERKEELRDSLVYFGDSLDSKDLDMAVEQVKKADFCLVLGSSVSVTPAASFVNHFLKHKGKDSLAIVNLQKTAVHGKGAIEVHYMVDKFLELLCEKMGLKPKENKFIRYIRFETLKEKDGDLVKLVSYDHNFEEVTSVYSAEYSIYPPATRMASLKPAALNTLQEKPIEIILSRNELENHQYLNIRMYCNGQTVCIPTEYVTAAIDKTRSSSFTKISQEAILEEAIQVGGYYQDKGPEEGINLQHLVPTQSVNN